MRGGEVRLQLKRAIVIGDGLVVSTQVGQRGAPGARLDLEPLVGLAAAAGLGVQRAMARNN